MISVLIIKTRDFYKELFFIQENIQNTELYLIFINNYQKPVCLRDTLYDIMINVKWQ